MRKEKIEIIENELLNCSFCDMAAGEVDFLVEGDKAYICDICVAKASDIVKDNFHKNIVNNKDIYKSDD